MNLFTEGVLLKNNMYSGTWINENNKWWYKHNDGIFTKDDWEFINGKWYFF
ncbi:glucan-binding YG repeat protein [Clostridium beijerinckii]|nr:hypothetical protein [Clostridium beijerinckii]NRT33455.1 glucan-binding YG repeat protein [Clostridium beijerinckii]NRT47118.1 glucan-binding YG repeat protein [Clostridium beijerinckii]NRZ18878.1 glucan-binding YG repeat protein [Clostridium beijerinckii]